MDIYLYNKPGGQGTGGKGKLLGLSLWLKAGVRKGFYTSGPRSLAAEEGPGRGSVPVLDLSLPTISLQELPASL